MFTTEELLKRFPFWGALHPVFGCSSSAAIMDIDNIVSQQQYYPRQQSIDSNSSSSSYSNSSSLASEDHHHPTDYDLDRYIHTGRRKEMERMQKSKEMLSLLRQRKQQEERQERLLLQHEKSQAEREFMNCLYKAGFTPTEAFYYL